MFFFLSWLRFKVAGIYQKMTKEVFGIVDENIKNELEPIKWKEIVPAMSLLAAGLVLSFFILLFEICLVKIKKFKTNRLARRRRLMVEKMFNHRFQLGQVWWRFKRPNTL